MESLEFFQCTTDRGEIKKKNFLLVHGLNVEKIEKIDIIVLV